MNVVVVEATQDDREVVRRLLEFNAYDFSEFDGRALDAQGEFGYRYLDHYWAEGENRSAMLILTDGQLAGCALIRLGAPHQVAEFFVLRKYRRQGIGTVAARKVLALWPGDWETHEAAGNDRAVAFWNTAIPVPFEETTDPTGTTQRFTIGDGEPLDAVHRERPNAATPGHANAIVRVQRVAAYGLAQDGDKVLLVRVASTARGGVSLWMLPGGGLDHGETPEQAVVREFAEETGYDVVVERLLEVGSDHRTLKDGTDYHGVFALYEVSIVGGALRDETDGSTDRAEWVRPSDDHDVTMLGAFHEVLARWSPRTKTP